ncbi:MAG: hypothetical protein AAB796_02550 [Patescibacteria group bacterium]
MRRKSLTILASLFFAFAVAFAFESPPAKAYSNVAQPTTMNAEGVGNPGPQYADMSFSRAVMTSTPNEAGTAIGCSQSVYASAGSIAITQSPHDMMINGGARNLYPFNNFRAGNLDGDDPCLCKKHLFAQEGNLVALPSRPVLLA